MSTLLLRLAAPMQSWGTSSKFDNRMTNYEPSKSGIIGMIAAAMGIKRDDSKSLVELNKLRFGVRIDQPGEIDKDYQTVHTDSSQWITYRYYISDAVFVVALEGPNELLRRIETALKHPVFPIFLGRMSYLPVGKLCLGIKEVSFIEALRKETWHAAHWYQRKMQSRLPETLEIVRDVIDNEDGYDVKDIAESFSRKRRMYSLREITRENILLKSVYQISTEHDPMDLLEE